jgi:transcriptional regulator of arginine metabolism
MEVMKQLRQQQIRDILEQRPIRTQHELAAALRERGFRATQATISRDVAELGLVKLGQAGAHVYALPPRDESAWTWRLLSELIYGQHREAFDQMLEDTAQVFGP